MSVQHENVVLSVLRSKLAVGLLSGDHSQPPPNDEEGETPQGEDKEKKPKVRVIR